VFSNLRCRQGMPVYNAIVRGEGGGETPEFNTAKFDLKKLETFL